MKSSFIRNAETCGTTLYIATVHSQNARAGGSRQNCSRVAACYLADKAVESHCDVSDNRWTLERGRRRTLVLMYKLYPVQMDKTTRKAPSWSIACWCNVIPRALSISASVNSACSARSWMIYLCGRAPAFSIHNRKCLRI